MRPSSCSFNLPYISDKNIIEGAAPTTHPTPLMGCTVGINRQPKEDPTNQNTIKVEQTFPKGKGIYIRVALAAASRPPTCTWSQLINLNILTTWCIYLPILQYNAPAVFVCDGGAGAQVGPGAVGWTARRP
jgi:hypothetical protein